MTLCQLHLILDFAAIHAMDKPTSLTVELRPSHQLAWLLAAVHCSALFVLGLTPLSWWVISIVSAAVLASAALNISRYALLRGPNAVRTLRFSDRGSLQLLTGDGRWHDGCLLGSSTVGAVLAVLNIRLHGGGTKHIVITGNGIESNDFRRLRVWLRWGPRPVDGDSETP